ncbi:low affinity immunoglobulin epsilon Fc receptor-like [Asterias amurensis]|uniref:low affinity immunoglobulin epsilon Fc receptor-like n=1 Tax=Asterias amurensis TaxID=7602 RepID=UPI003AB8BCB4
MVKFQNILIRTLLIYMYLLAACCNANDEACMASIGVGVGTCPPTWIQWKDKCFKATKEPLTWFQAHDECSKMGGVMATPNSTDDTQQLLNITHNQHFWIDCNDLVHEGVWECKEGETVIYYRDWADGEPNEFRGQYEDCVKYRIKTGTNGWNDVPCEYAYQLAVCKKPAPSLHFLHV